MKIVALVGFSIVPERLDEARVLFDSMLEVTRGFAGAETIDTLISTEDPTQWTLYEVWSSAEEELAYRTFRAGEGAVPELPGLLSARPTLQRFTRAD